MNERTLKLMQDINKKFKKPVVRIASSIPKIPRIRSIIAPALDYCMTGGMPINRIVEFYGPESAGKTWAALQYVREFQNFDWGNRVERGITEILQYKQRVIKMETGDWEWYEPVKWTATQQRGSQIKNVVLIDAEGTYDPVWGAYLGIDNKRLIHCVPETGEMGVDIAEIFLSDPDTGLLLYDSVAVSKPAAEIAKSMEDQNMGVTARFWNRAAAKFQMALNGNEGQDTTLILINRAYDKIGLVFGNPEVVGNGSGLKYAKSISLKISKVGAPTKEKIDGVDTITGQVIRVENKKNKTGRPFRQAEMFWSMIDDEELGLKYGFPDTCLDLIEIGLKEGLVTQPSARTYQFGAIKGNSRDAFVEAMRGNKRAQKALYEKILVIGTT